MTSEALAARFPSVDILERLSLSIAALDVVMSPEWEYRCYSFDPSWLPGERMASMRNGSGDSYNIVFGQTGTVVRGFDHESALSPWVRPDGSLAPGLLDGFPASLRPAIDEPAFRTEGGPITDLTFCIWQLAGEQAWSSGSVTDVDDSAEWLFDVVLDGTPAGYKKFAAEYYEEQISIDAVRAFYELQAADATLITSINAEVDVNEAIAELRQINYPVVGFGGDA